MLKTREKPRFLPSNGQITVEDGSVSLPGISLLRGPVSADGVLQFSSANSVSSAHYKRSGVIFLWRFEREPKWHQELMRVWSSLGILAASIRSSRDFMRPRYFFAAGSTGEESPSVPSTGRTLAEPPEAFSRRSSPSQNNSDA